MRAILFNNSPRILLIADLRMTVECDRRVREDIAVAQIQPIVTVIRQADLRNLSKLAQWA